MIMISLQNNSFVIRNIGARNVYNQNSITSDDFYSMISLLYRICFTILWISLLLNTKIYCCLRRLSNVPPCYSIRRNEREKKDLLERSWSSGPKDTLVARGRTRFLRKGEVQGHEGRSESRLLFKRNPPTTEYLFWPVSPTPANISTFTYWLELILCRPGDKDTTLCPQILKMTHLAEKYTFTSENQPKKFALPVDNK